MRRPKVVYQLGAPDSQGRRHYLGLDGPALGRHAQALARAWRLAGLGQGDRVALFDFGTSPTVFLASSLFTPYLRQGAAEIVGCTPICNDGEATMSGRAIDILRLVQPRAMFVHPGVLPPWLQEAERRFIPIQRYLHTLVVQQEEGVFPEVRCRALEKELDLQVLRLLRVDESVFFAAECPECRLFHTWEDLYRVGLVTGLNGAAGGRGAGRLVVAPRRQRDTRPARQRHSVATPEAHSGTVTDVTVRVAGSGCPRGPSDTLLEVQA